MQDFPCLGKKKGCKNKKRNELRGGQSSPTRICLWAASSLVLPPHNLPLPETKKSPLFPFCLYSRYYYFLLIVQST